MSKRQVQDDGMPRGLVLIGGVFGGVFLSIVWCAWGAHFDRLTEMEDDISRTELQVAYLEAFQAKVEEENKAVTYTCDEMMTILENFSKQGRAYWSFDNTTVKGKCK